MTGGIKFSFDTDDLLISTDHLCRRKSRSRSHFKQQSVVDVEELEAIQVSCTCCIYLNFPRLLDRLWHHVVFHHLLIILLSAHAIARNEVEPTTFTITVVLNSAEPEVFSALFHELTSHGLVWRLNL